MKESQLDNKTSIATNDYVRMVDENGNSVKIKKDSFIAAIRDALPSTISDGETGGGSVLSIIDGALKTRTDANLASVLGVGYMKQLGQIADASLMDALDTFVAYCAPIHGKDIGYLYSFCGKRYVGQGPLSALQIFYAYNDTNLYFRYYRVSSNSWNAWQRIESLQ